MKALLNRRKSKRGQVSPLRDDRIFPLTQRVAWLIIPFLAAAALVLYGLPGRTTEFFAWTIRPEMTPIIMGAGYAVGAYFFFRVATGDEWHTVAPVFLGIATFTWFMAVATVLHWENFNHSHEAFFLWVILYAVTPILIPTLWALNRRTDSRAVPEGAVTLPQSIRMVGGALGVILIVSALVLFAVPDLMIDAWPWAVSPLTARILAGWIALFGVANSAAVTDLRWTGSRILLQCQIGGIALVLVGVVRAWHNFDQANPLTWAGVGSVVLYLCAVTALYAWMERR